MKSTLQLKAVLRGGRTVLENCYHTQPFKIMQAGPGGRELQLMLLSASPGLLDGDEQHLQIGLGAGAALRLDTQSYQRFYAMSEGARQELEVGLEAGASLCYLPLPAVPHADARVESRNVFRLAAGSRLCWGEVLTCGRKGSGERFLFQSYKSTTQVWYAERLLLQEVVLVEPATMKLESLGLYEGFTHQASLICIDESRSQDDLIALLKPLLDNDERVLAGITALPAAGVLVRILGQGAELLYDRLRALADAATVTNSFTFPTEYHAR